MTITQFLISLSIIMLMLSFITERVANFLKIHYQDKTLFIFFPRLKKVKGENKLDLWLRTNIKILAYRQPSIPGEKEREYRILIINIVIGIFVAALSNANLFQIAHHIFNGSPELAVPGWDLNKFDPDEDLLYLNIGAFYFIFLLWSGILILFNGLIEISDSQKISFWGIRIPFFLALGFTILLYVLGIINDDNKYFFSIISHSLGFIATGLFLSLGSKFWHDLLDMLFKVKNVRQRLSEEKTFTDYSSAKQIAVLAETPQYDVAQKLHDKYRAEIIKINGVVSYGLNTVLDERSKLFVKRIEVEYTTPESQAKLIQIRQKGSIKIKLNTFYLVDYLDLLHTRTIEVLPLVGESDPIVKIPPICYAFNKNSPSVLGSFGIIKDETNGQYRAISNLHVFADSKEFEHFGENEFHQLTHLEVGFKIGEEEFSGKIIPGKYKIGEENGYGHDFCTCAISKEVVEAYKKSVSETDILPRSDEEMKTFGAYSKQVTFYSLRSPTFVKVKYPKFEKKLYLHKIKTSDRFNLEKGDSGSVVNYCIDDDEGRIHFKGIVVAKSDFYSYMALI